MLGAATAGVVLAGLSSSDAEANTATITRPKRGDQLVYANGEREGTPVTPDSLTEDSELTFAWAQDPQSGVVRKASRLNLILLVRLDPATLDAETRARSADGIVAYSAICTHEQCPVSEWNKERGVLHCPCHGSEFNPAQGAQVVGGPAPRVLPALPIGLQDGTLVVTGSFTSRVGATRI